jgi:hypothetical protein
MTKFYINNRRYYLLTAASIYLIFHYLVIGLTWTRKTFDFVLSNDFNVLNVLLILALCIVYLTFISYFSFYNLRTLKGLSVSIIFLELFIQTVPYVLNFSDIAINSLTTVTLILAVIWLVLVLRLDTAKFQAVNSLKLYAKMWGLSLLLTVTFTVLMGWTDFPALFAPHYFFSLLPYFAILKFAGGLRNRTDIQTAST